MEPELEVFSFSRVAEGPQIMFHVKFRGGFIQQPHNAAGPLARWFLHPQREEFRVVALRMKGLSRLFYPPLQTSRFRSRRPLGQNDWPTPMTLLGFNVV